MGKQNMTVGDVAKVFSPHGGQEGKKETESPGPNIPLKVTFPVTQLLYTRSTLKGSINPC